MIVDLHDGFLRPERRPATRVLVCDNYGQPLVAVVEVAPDKTVCVSAGDDADRFRAVLKEFGFLPAATTVVPVAGPAGPVIL